MNRNPAIASIATLALLCFYSFAFQDGQGAYGRFYIRDMGHERLEVLKSSRRIRWWVELGDQLLVLSDPITLQRLSEFYEVEVLLDSPQPARLRFARLPLKNDLVSLRALARDGRYAVVQLERVGDEDEQHLHHKPVFPDRNPEGHALPAHGHHQVVLRPFVPNTVLVRQAANDPPRAHARKRDTVQELVNRFHTARWYMDVYKLSCLNRFTHGEEIKDARDFLVEAFERIGGLQVSTQSFNVGQTETENVIAVLEGTEIPDDRYIVGAHYDSISEDPQNMAPGAEDNAGGVAAVLELARIFSQNPPKSTIIFICYSGEEQFLVGSGTHSESILASGDKDKIKAVLVMDMIGYSQDDDLDLLLETSSLGSFMFQGLTDAATNYTDLRILTTLNPFGSDHVSYLNRGIPALLLIENDWTNYPGYHRTNDEIDWIGLDMGPEVVRMAIGFLAETAGI